ncbi:MAG TPA: tol-pal system protein YbgF [Aliidongia sp.]|uniref:tol-pal system protein YbgF n=1 Tax=Aliidongia sp. TaxID=1914230 RepID=UPI002DDD2513|nr:tol-pal system protein YbgF [Aliidongia sp.]HEV2676628.1 tol-pal system protein YbgF [Aliidongia sp.]
MKYLVGVGVRSSSGIFMHKFCSGLAAILLSLGAVSAMGSAFAQDRSTNDRLDRLERDLNQVQRQLYRNEVPVSGPPGVAPSGDGGTPALNAEIRMDQLEQQMRTMTGQLEEVQNGVSELKNRLDKQQQDNEQRLQALEHPDGGGAPPPRGGAQAVDAPISASPGKPASPGGAGNMDAPASTGGFLSSPGGGGGKPASPPPGKAVALPAGSTTDQYNFAFGLLRSQDYPAAESAFSQFVLKHPQDELAGNAQYWLGETFFVRNDYASAAAAFAKGYQQYPKSPKAQDNLLKLGVSLGNTGRKQEACLIFGKLERDFPNLAPTNKDRAVREKQRLGC